MNFPRGFLRQPAVAKVLQDREQSIQRDLEDRRIAESNDEIYLRAIRRMWQETEGMK